MIGWFKFGDIDTRNYDHIVVCEGEVDSASVRLFDEVVIAGKNGTLLIDTGRYDNVLHSYDIIVHEEYVDSLIQLRNDLQSQTGYKTLIDGFNVGESYIARLDSSFIPKQNRNRNAGTLHIEFSRFPQRYLASGKREKIIGQTWENVETVSGDIVQVPNTGYKAIRSLKVALEPIQDLNGYDKPWVGGAGKNLLNPNSVSNLNNVTFTDGVCEATQSDTRAWSPVLQAYNNGSYVKNLATGSSIPYTFQKDDTFNQLIFGHSGAQKDIKIRFNISDLPNGEYKWWYTLVSNTNPFSWKDMMITKSSETDATYEPYSNICPIIGRDSVDVVRTGKNVFGGRTLGQAIVDAVNRPASSDFGSDAHGDFVTIVAGGAVNRKIFSNSVKFKDATQYTIILRITRGATGTLNSNLAVSYTDGTSSTIYITSSTADEVPTIVFVTTAGKTVSNIMTTFGGGTSRLYYEDSGVFEGTLTADDFEPYQGESYTTDLGRTVYGGTLNLISGVLTVDRVMLDLGSLNWNYNPSWNGYPAFYCSTTPSGILPPSGTSNPTDYMCSIYEGYSRSYLYANDVYGFCVPTDGRVSIRDRRYSDATSFKTAMSGVQFVYPLATPQTIQLTPEQITLLTGENNIWSGGEITLTYGDDPYILVNPTPFDAKPLIVVTGSGTFTIEDKTLTVLQGASTFQTIYIDCETMEAWQRVDGGIVSRNDYVQNIDDGFPVLKSGVNNITVGTGIMFLRITPRWWRV